MPAGWPFHPLIACAAAVPVLTCALYLVCTLRVRRRPARPPAQAPARAPESDIARLEKRLEDLTARQRAAEVAAAPPPAAVAPAFNMSRRTYALRLYRRGQTAEQIASSLGLAAGEVRLLVKVHRILVERAGGLKPGAESADKSNEQNRRLAVPAEAGNPGRVPVA